MLFVGDSASSCQPVLEPSAVADNVLQQLELARNQAPVPTRSMPVIFTPNGVASALVMPLMAAFNGKTVLEGASPLGQRLGEKVFDDKFQLWDDPLVAFQPSSRPCDDEGVPSQRTPLIEIGKMVLNRNPENYFAEVEQSAFSPGNFVPGIFASPDKMLQGRLFSYPDTHRHRLGPNYHLLPVNSPKGCELENYQRDGFMRFDNNGGGGPNYWPNSMGGPAPDISFMTPGRPFRLTG